MNLDILEAIGSHADAKTRANMCLASKEYLNLSHDFLKYQKVMKQIEAVTDEVRKIVSKDNYEFHSYLTIYGFMDSEDVVETECANWDIVQFMERFRDYHYKHHFSVAFLNTIQTSY